MDCIDTDDGNDDFDGYSYMLHSFFADWRLSHFLEVFFIDLNTWIIADVKETTTYHKSQSYIK